MKLPNKFEFKVYDMEYYIMAKHPYDGEYYCYDIDGSTADQNESLWTADAIGRNVTEGCWVITKDLDEPIKAEPEMVFPFSYRHSDNSCGGLVSKVPNKGIKFQPDETGEEEFYNYWTEDEIKDFIKDGTWIVTSVGSASVGEQKPACVHEYFWGEVSEAEGEHNEAADNTVGNLTIKVDSSQVSEATHKFNMLAQAVENVNISLESMQAIMKDMGIV